MVLNQTHLWPVIVGGAGFVTTVFAIPYLARCAKRCGLVDHPSVRKIHGSPIPLCGGIAVFIPTAIALIAFTVLSYFQYLVFRPNSVQLLALLIASAWMLFLGIIDDAQQLSWRQKLLGQCAGILILILGEHSIRSANVPFFGPVAFGFTGPIVFGLAILVITNAINLIDGLDGLAGGICFFAGLVYGIVGLFKGDIFAGTMGFVIAGSLLGFLSFNLPPAKVFLGDAGSLMLGLLLGTLATSNASTMFPGQHSATFWVMLAPFLPFTIALLDVFIAIIRRWIRGGRIFFPDSDHLHHRLLAEFKSPRAVVGVIYSISFLFAALSVLMTLRSGTSSSIIYVGLVVVSAITLGVVALRIYRVDHLPQVIIDRPHFRFLDTYRKFISARALRASTTEELIELLQTGVRDLHFDSVEVFRYGRAFARWVRPAKLHADAPRSILKREFAELGLSIRATIPKHDSDAYQQYLESSWLETLDAFALAYARTVRLPVQARREHSGSANLATRTAVK
jgi:UDP-GlcNAc:undecaprenyl-phosphate/decaprenyl-phosphate GlcNAc-1-phosphate transferase